MVEQIQNKRKKKILIEKGIQKKTINDMVAKNQWKKEEKNVSFFLNFG